jgi:Bacterial pre-peptidase C-terminal domain
MLDLAAADIMSAQEVMSAREIAGGGDTVLGTTLTTDSIALGTSLAGFINTTSDRDWYAVTLTAGVTYLFNLDGAGTSALQDPYLYLRDSAGLLIASDDDSGPELNSQIEFTASTTGTYFLDAAAFGAGTGQYTLTATASIDSVAGGVSTSASIAIGASVTGAIDSSNDHDWYAVTLTAGFSYVFNVAASGSSSNYPTLYLHNAAGSYLGSGGLPQLGFEATSTGTYYVDVSAYTTGQFTLTAAVSPDVISGNVSNHRQYRSRLVGHWNHRHKHDHDWYAVTLNAGVTYTFVATGSAYPSLDLRNAAGAIAAYGGYVNGGGQVNFSAATTGTYYVDVFSYNAGQFALSATINPDQIAGNTSTSGTISIGSSRTGVIDYALDHDWYAVTLNAGTTYLFNVTGAIPSVVPTLYLYDALGGFAAVGSTHLAYETATTGTYYIDVSSYGTGQFTLSAIVSPDTTAGNINTTGRIAIGSSLTGSIDSYDDHDWYAVTLNAGVSYSFSATGSAYPTIYLHTATGAIAAFGNSQLTFDATTTDTYYIDVFAQITGQFTISASVNPDQIASNTSTTGTLTTGSPRTGVIDYSGDHDWYAITLTAGTNYVFSVAGSNASHYINIALINASGVDIAFGSAQEINFDAATTGTYFVDVNSYSTGQFTVSAAISPDLIGANVSTTGSIAIGSSRNSVIVIAHPRCVGLTRGVGVDAVARG